MKTEVIGNGAWKVTYTLEEIIAVIKKFTESEKQTRKGEIVMAPKNDQLNKMIAKAEEQVQHCQEQLNADPPPDDAAAAALMDTIDAQLAKIERLQSQQARLDALKKGGKK